MKILTTKEVANIFQVSEKTVTQKFNKQGLKYIKIGSKDYRYLEEDVEEFARNKTKSETTEIIAYTKPKKHISKGTMNSIIDYDKMKIL